MNRILSAGCAGLLSALAIAAPASASPVTLRVEGATGPLAGPATVDPGTLGTLTRNGAACGGTNSPAGALELGTGGDWDGRQSAFGSVGVTRIKTEDYPTSLSAGSQSSHYWAVYVNGVATDYGPCDANTLNAGDEVVFAAACFTATTDCYKDGTLTATGPATARPGEPFDVAVDQTTTTFGPPPDFTPVTTTGPAPDATVSGGAAPATTGSAGSARVTIAQRGPAQLRVTREQQVPDTVSVCVTDGADGFCGTRRPDGTTLPPEVGGQAPAAPDTSAPAGTITGIAEGQRFTRAQAPRRLTADVADPSGVLQVKLALTRQVGSRCWWFSGTRERFVRSRCGKRPRFKLEGTGNVDYLLPQRLGRGRYVFDVLATDKAYNRDELARGRNRVVFTVR